MWGRFFGTDSKIINVVYYLFIISLPRLSLLLIRAFINYHMYDNKILAKCYYCCIILKMIRCSSYTCQKISNSEGFNSDNNRLLYKFGNWLLLETRKCILMNRGNITFAHNIATSIVLLLVMVLFCLIIMTLEQGSISSIILNIPYVYLW